MALPVITSQLDSDDAHGTLKTELLGLPKGATLFDGSRKITMLSSNGIVDLTGWNLAKGLRRQLHIAGEGDEHRGRQRHDD